MRKIVIRTLEVANVDCGGNKVAWRLRRTWAAFSHVYNLYTTYQITIDDYHPNFRIINLSTTSLHLETGPGAFLRLGYGGSVLYLSKGPRGTLPYRGIYGDLSMTQNVRIFAKKTTHIGREGALKLWTQSILFCCVQLTLVRNVIEDKVIRAPVTSIMKILVHLKANY